MQLVNFLGIAASVVSLGALGAQEHQVNKTFSALPSGQGAEIAPEERLYLAVTLNHVPLHQIASFFRKDGSFYASAQTLRDIGLAVPAAEKAADWVRLDSMPGLQIAYDEAEQRMDLVAPVALLSRPMVDLGYETPVPPHIDPLTRAPGLLLNYDLYGQRYDQARSLSGFTELRLFGVGQGIWRTSNVLRAVSNYAEKGYRNTRLDTSWQWDFPQSMVSLTLGDTTSSAFTWTRSMRFGGLRLSRNFSLQPYRVTVPLASFVGEAAMPSIVDLYINGVREAQHQVAPGRFQVIGTPMLNGAGSAQMVITDITGQSRVVNFSLYNSARLLQVGLSDWSMEIGKVRRRYGINSFSYADDTMVSGSARYGVSNRLTLESHLETRNRLRMGGVGALLLLGERGGVLSTSYAESSSASLRGRQHSMGYEWQGRRASFHLATQQRNDTFRDAASLDGSTLPRRTDQAFAGVNIAYGQLGISYVRQDYWGLPRVRYAGLSWSQTLGRYGHINLGVNRDLTGSSGTTAYVYWSLPLGEHRQIWASSERQVQGNSSTVGTIRSIPSDSDGWGWRAQASAGDPSTGGQAEVSQLTRFGQWRAGVEHWRGQESSALYGGVTGGLLLMQGSLLPMRRVNDAFALVTTDSIPDVPVMLENRFVGKTDEKGQLLVTPLNAWQNNDISIDPLALPADVSVQRTRMDAVPATGSGMLARFPMRVTRIVELSLRGPDGQWIPPGTQVSINPGKQQAVVGYEGRLYLQDPEPGAQIQVSIPSTTCVATLPLTLPEHGRTNLGDLSCN